MASDKVKWDLIGGSLMELSPQAAHLDPLHNIPGNLAQAWELLAFCLFKKTHTKINMGNCASKPKTPEHSLK